MELTPEIKEKIDSYFENISSEELIAISIEKYGLEQNQITMIREIEEW